MADAIRTLTRRELTAALAARQMLLERAPLDPVEAIRRLSPLQGQDPPAPYIALAARLAGFSRADLEQAFHARQVLKSTLMRTTLHIVAHDEYPAYAQLARQARLRTWRKHYPHLDQTQVTAELDAWFGEQPRSNGEIREHVGGRYEGVPDTVYGLIFFARTLLPLVQLPPAGLWGNRQRPLFVVDRRPLPTPTAAAALAVRRYLAAFGPASRRDIAAWSGLPQRDFAAALAQMRTVSYHDEQGVELLDLPGVSLPPASTQLPVRFLSRWDQVMLAHADRARIMSPEIQALKLGLAGDQTVTVDGRIVASWILRRGRERVAVEVTRHLEISRAARDRVRAEARRVARWIEPDARGIEAVGL
jgi:hypothetical protein